MFLFCNPITMIANSAVTILLAERGGEIGNPYGQFSNDSQLVSFMAIRDVLYNFPLLSRSGCYSRCIFSLPNRFPSGHNICLQLCYLPAVHPCPFSIVETCLVDVGGEFRCEKIIIVPFIGLGRSKLNYSLRIGSI